MPNIYIHKKFLNLIISSYATKIRRAIGTVDSSCLATQDMLINEKYDANHFVMCLRTLLETS